jgi:hypothetical protein
MNFISSTTIFAALVLGSFFSAQACAGDAAHAKLIEHLLTDVDSSNVPPGYDFLTTEGFAIGDAAADRKIEGAIHALFSRKSRLPGSRKFDTGTEAIVYFVFPTSEDALQYSNRTLAGDDVAVWSGDSGLFHSNGPTTTTRVELKGPQGATLQMRCKAFDYVINCSSAVSVVTLELDLQEPKLRAAKTDAERQRIVAARMQTEAGGLLRTALEHLKRAENDN